MDKQTLRRGCALATTLCMLLTGCSLGSGDSSTETSTETAAASATAPAVEAPQTTASPVEQTGYGYVAEEAQEIDGAILEKLVLLGEKPWLVTQQESGGMTLRNLETGEQVQPELSGTILAACGYDTGVWCCVEQDGSISLRQYDSNGPNTSTVELSLDDAYPSDLAVDGNGYFYVLSSDRVLVYSGNGKNVSSLTLPTGSVGMRLASLSDGQVVLTSSESGKGNAVRLLTTESIGKNLTDASSPFLSYSGYGALLSGGGNLYVMDTENNQMETLLNWVDSGVDSSILADCIAGSPDTIWYVTSNETGMKLGSIRRVEASALSQRETVTVGVSGSLDAALTGRITAMAAQYNQSQQEKSIHLVDYSLYADGDQRLSQDAGDLDLVVGAEEVMDAADLMDLTELYDDQVGADTLLAGVQNATAADRLPLSFLIETLYGSNTLVGDSEGWTPQEFADAVSAHTDVAVLKMCNSYDALSVLLQGCAGSTEGIAPLLEACSAIPVEDQALYALAANSSTDDEAVCVKNGTLLLGQAELKDFMDLRQLSAQVGDSLVYKGYPAESGNGTMLKFTAYLGISKGSQHAQAAWDFLKQIVMDSSDFLGAQGLGFPVLEQDFMTMAESAAKKVTFQNDSGETVEQDPTIWVDGTAMSVSPFTETEIQDLLTWINGGSGAYGCSQTRLETGNQALKDVIENGTDAAKAAKEIQ